jgi:hypothetical protein
MLDFELGGYLLGAPQVGVCNGYQLCFRDQAPDIQSVLLPHCADPKYAYAQLCHNRPLSLVALASCRLSPGHLALVRVGDAPTTAAGMERYIDQYLIFTVPPFLAA